MTDIGIITGILSGIAGIVIGLLGTKRNSDADSDRHSRESATIISEIGYVKSGIDDIKRRQEKSDERHYALVLRVSRLETAVARLEKEG